MLFIMEKKSKSFSGCSEFKYDHGFDDGNRSKSYSFNGNKGDVLEDSSSGNPETKRKKRVASYNMYSMEGKLKSSVRNSFKWIKNKFNNDKCYDV